MLKIVEMLATRPKTLKFILVAMLDLLTTAEIQALRLPAAASESSTTRRRKGSFYSWEGQKCHVRLAYTGYAFVTFFASI
jgi:hypothetical protein